jgi:endonuclease YncB( thermonuclease family)
LSLNRPRRIFRSFLLRIEPKWLLSLLGIALVAAAGASLAMLPGGHVSSQPPSPLAPSAEELTAPPAQVAVVDGGTLRLGDRIVLLRGVEPPPRDTPCGAQDCAAAAAKMLADMVRDTSVTCRLAGQDPLGRPYGICLAKGTELNRGMAGAGKAGWR